MNPVAKLYVKQFLRGGLIIASAIFMVDWAIEGTISSSFVEIAITFIASGVFWSLLMGSFHLVALKRMGVKKFTDDALSVKHRVEVHTQLDTSALLDQLKRDPFFGKMAIAETGNEIEIIRSVSWDANEVIVKIEPIQNAQAYAVTSKLRHSFGQVDFGKSLECIMQFQKLVGRPSTVSAM